MQPKQDPNNPYLWSPGVKLGVKEGSFMHQTELFGPVLGVMRAKNLEEAIRFANGTQYGLTSGIHSLDKREVNIWIKKIAAGNCYINRGITGAIVQRQPFGGCKASSFGHGSKAGGPNYITQFMHKKQKNIPQDKATPLPNVVELTGFLEKFTSENLGVWLASISNYSYWIKEFSKEFDPSLVVGEDNFLIYRHRHNMGFRLQKDDALLDVFRIFAAALTCRTPLEISYDPKESPLVIHAELRRILGTFTFTEENAQVFHSRVEKGAFERIRLASKATKELEQAAVVRGIYLNQEPVLASGRLELLNYLREVALSIDYHRYGNLGLRENEKRAEII